MKTFHLFFFSLLLLTCSCKKENDKIKNNKVVELIKIPNGNDPKYLLNHPKSDTLCSSDIQKAKNDIAKYNKLYIKTICFGCDNKPFEEELEEVLKKRKIKQVIEDIGCVVYEGQTQGCYSSYIELKMKEKYGENYFSDIEKEAEKILIKNIKEKNKLLSIYDLEDKEKPKILNPNVKIESDYYSTIKVSLPTKINSYKSLFVDITFVIEKDGTISNLSISNWVNDAIDEKFKKQLIEIAFETLKKDYNSWKPGTYKGNITRTENTLRIDFKT